MTELTKEEREAKQIVDEYDEGVPHSIIICVAKALRAAREKAWNEGYDLCKSNPNNDRSPFHINPYRSAP